MLKLGDGVSGRSRRCDLGGHQHQLQVAYWSAAVGHHSCETLNSRARMRAYSEFSRARKDGVRLTRIQSRGVLIVMERDGKAHFCSPGRELRRGKVTWAHHVANAANGKLLTEAAAHGQYACGAASGASYDVPRQHPRHATHEARRTSTPTPDFTCLGSANNLCSSARLITRPPPDERRANFGTAFGYRHLASVGHGIPKMRLCMPRGILDQSRLTSASAHRSRIGGVSLLAETRDRR